MPHLFGTQSVRVTRFFRINRKWCKDKLHDLSTMKRTTNSPSEMIKKLKWRSLEKRRNHTRLTLMHKYLHKTVDIEEQFAIRARCSNINLVPINAQIHTYTNSFAPATIKDWSMLLPNIKNEPNLEIFRKKLFNIV